MITDLTDLRNQIDAVDREILSLLKKRFDIALQMGEIKKSEKLNLYQPDRETEMLLERRKIASEFGISEEFVEKVFDILFTESLRIQQEG